MAIRVLLICGSLQEKSSNRAALDVVRAKLGGVADVSVEDAIEVGLIPPFNSDREDVADSSLTEFRAQIARASAVVVATPEYAASTPGALKNAFDWIVGSAGLYGKPVGLIAAGSTGGVYVRQQLIRSLTWQGAHVVAHLGIGTPRTKSDEQGRFTDAETLAAIEGIALEVVDAVGMSGEERLALVERITSEAGVEGGHVAPMQGS
ncbi:MAG: NAD(P)H-dependent oxidoreductase [Dehalococcoidia bacterium]|jgi:chromate reductase, NAD(P)H dehydrogenase (quinone)|nr:NAD(P)H-dependent oxidoreductase [Dehalococcoidia bacterium]